MIVVVDDEEAEAVPGRPRWLLRRWLEGRWLSSSSYTVCWVSTIVVVGVLYIARNMMSD